MWFLTGDIMTVIKFIELGFCVLAAIVIAWVLTTPLD
jgi:hypothetical protein